MTLWFPGTQHPRAWQEKRQERERHLDSISRSYSPTLSLQEQKVHAYTIPELVTKCQDGDVTPEEILRVYTKKTLEAHRKTNCITDMLVDETLGTSPRLNGPFRDADSGAGTSDKGRPLLGVPVSLKDTINIVGHDSTIGLAANLGQPAQSNSSIVRLLQDAGALLIAKTTVPTALLGIDTQSDIFGLTTNPYSPNHGVGASGGGGGALLACGGSKIEIGSDVGGSVRIPAHACGVYGLKSSVGRFPILGNLSSVTGLEAVPLVSAPMAASLEDMEEFWKRVMDMRPWEYDYTCVPVPWRPLKLHSEERKLKWGVIWEDGVIPPSPACTRALRTVVEALKAEGHEVVDFIPPPMSELLEVGYQLLFADGGKQIQDTLLPSESTSPAVKATLALVNLPRMVKKMIASYYRASDPIYAGLLDVMHPKSVLEERQLVAKRDDFRLRWNNQWVEEGLDFVLTVPFPFPALENGTAEKASLMSAGYAFIFNLLDFVAGVMPVTNVDRQRDSLAADFTSSAEYHGLNNIAKLAYTTYDADKMHGLPLGVQIVTRRLEEEKAIEGMKIIKDALRKNNSVFKAKYAM